MEKLEDALLVVEEERRTGSSDGADKFERSGGDVERTENDSHLFEKEVTLFSLPQTPKFDQN